MLSRKELLEFIQPKLTPSFDLLDVQDMTGIVQLWSTVLDEPEFSVAFAERQKDNNLKVHVILPKEHLLAAFASLGRSMESMDECARYNSSAVAILKDLVVATPFGLDAAFLPPFAPELAVHQNNEYKKTLELAERWLTFWGPGMISTLADISEPDAMNLSIQVQYRLSQL